MNKGLKPWRPLDRSSQTVDVVVGKFLTLTLSHFFLLVFAFVLVMAETLLDFFTSNRQG